MTLPSLSDQGRLRTILEALKDPDHEWNETEFERHLLTWQRMNQRTVKQTLRDLPRLTAHPVAPMRLHETRYEMVDSFLRFVHQREAVEGKLGTALKNDFKAIIALGKDRGMPRKAWPKRPPLIYQANEVLPRPEDIHKLLHAEWVPNAHNSYEQHLVQFLLAFDFGFGIRMPSETHALRLSDFDPKTHTIVIREPKKTQRTRRLYVEPEWLCCSHARPSLANYLKWRAKVDVGGSDAFFLKPDGGAFPTREALSAWLNGRVQPPVPVVSRVLGSNLDGQRAVDRVGLRV